MKKISLVISLFISVSCYSQVSYVVQGVGKYHAYGLSTDTKPVNPPTNCLFTETNTGNMYRATGGSWVLISAASTAAVPTNTNQLTNGAGYITASSLPNMANYLTTATAASTYQPSGIYATGTGTATGLNTGDGAVNALYSGLAGSKQDLLVSGTNIKTVNGTTILGSGNLVVSGGATRVFQPADVINSTTTISDVTGLSFPVVANTTYAFKFRIIYSAAATTTGSRWTINAPAVTFMNYQSQYTLTATTITNNQGLSAIALPAAANASSLTTNNIAIIEGIIRPSANGTVIARFNSEVAASAITSLGNGRSFVEYQIIN